MCTRTVLIHAERARLTPAGLITELMAPQRDVDLSVSVMSAGELFHGCCAPTRCRGEHVGESWSRPCSPRYRSSPPHSQSRALSARSMPA